MGKFSRGPYAPASKRIGHSHRFALVQTVFLCQVVLDRSCVFFAKHSLVDQNFADLTVEECLINTFSNSACACNSTKHGPLTALPEYTLSVDVERVGLMVVHSTCGGEILSDAAAGASIKEIVPRPGGTEPRRYMRL